MVYEGGVPNVLRYTSTREAGPTAPDPATQGGALDPLTTMFAVLRSGVMITCAESCTGGMLAAALTDLPGSSAMMERVLSV